jgi:hypothetical protein
MEKSYRCIYQEMKYSILFFSILLPIFVLGQPINQNDTAAIYKLVIDTLLLNKSSIIAETSGTVHHYDLYGNFKQARLKAIEELEAQGKLFPVWVEQDATKYETTVTEVLREIGIEFDTIAMKDIVLSGQINLTKLLPTYKFLQTNKAPLGYSSLENFLKKKMAFRLSELLFVKQLNVAVLKVTIEKKSNRNEHSELIVLLKQHDNWTILKRIQSSS